MKLAKCQDGSSRVSKPLQCFPLLTCSSYPPLTHSSLSWRFSLTDDFLSHLRRSMFGLVTSQHDEDELRLFAFQINVYHDSWSRGLVI
jgi:hypothetical protein